MREITVRRAIAAPRDAVWDVLADFANIADWNGGVKKSYSTGDDPTGLGATRHCDLAPLGALEETITHWEPNQQMVVRIDSASKLPIKSGLVTFSLETNGQASPTELRYQYDAKLGPLERVFGGMLDRQLTKGFTGFLADLEAQAQRVAAAA